MAASDGNELVGQSIPALLTYLDSGGNPVTGLNAANITWQFSNPAIASNSFDGTNWQFKGLAVGETNVIATDPSTGFTAPGTLTCTAAAGQPASLKLTWGTPV